MNDKSIQELLERLDSDDVGRQAKALLDLIDAKVYQAAPKIVKLLKSPDIDIRGDAAYALGYVGIHETESVGAALMEILNDEDELVISEVVEVLGGLQYTPAIELIGELLRQDPSPLVRASAAEALGYLGGAEAIESLELALRDSDEDESVRAYAANSLGLLGTNQILSKLETYVKLEPSLSVKAELLAARYWLGAKEDIKQLLSLLNNADEHLVTLILNILTDLTERQVPSTLHSDAPNIREVLSNIGQRIPILRPHAEKLMVQA
ncbi:HEAT repeat domain-containing protein [Phormidium sp. CCY1219]|uniref:HEAT repeat domain-containing protein n=1 Tax=Phormidium sp. CCY1219 TaxID=2886104 RepID=UPI002D1EEB75|nr:HEAT repeat domain-containing protein [Phormidium sp. CCY1219]MEB3826282.1 HEAT repeat domain-containing protein [Phormidium sp. CCY1219]